MTAAAGFLRKLRLTLEMIKFEHSVFALPFALTGALLAIREDGFAGARSAAGSSSGSWSRWWRRARRRWRSTGWSTPRSTRAIRARRRGICRRACCRRGFAWAFVVGVVGRCSCWLPALLNPLCLQAGSGGAGDRVLLLVHEAIHLVLAPGAGVCAGNRAGRGVDRDPRLARSAHPLAHGRGDVLDRRLRHHLLLPGLRVRPARRPVQPAAAARHRAARCGSRALFHVG